MPFQNNRREKIKFEPHNRKAGVAKFKRNLGHRKSRRWRNRINNQWTEERSFELREPPGPTRSNGHDSWQRDQM